MSSEIAKTAYSSRDINGPFDAVGILSLRIRRRREFGLYNTEGKPVPDCDVAGKLTYSTPLPTTPGHSPEKTVDGPVLFAGLAPQQFGHTILNSLGRLWALDEMPADTKLLYLPQIRPIRERYRFVRPLLDLLGISAPIILHDGPTRYTSIYTAQDDFGERHDGRMSGRMRTWLERRLPAPGPVEPGKKVYFTRSKLGPTVGRYCNEDILEQSLRSAGYTIFAPETFSLSEQISCMQTAEALVFAESSALHLYGLVQRAGQKVAVIQRRKVLPPLILNQLDDGPATINLVDAISSVDWPPVEADNISLATLDFDILREKLIAGAFISHRDNWRIPTPEEMQTSLRAGLDSSVTLIPDQDRQRWLNRRRRQRAKAHRL